MELYVLNHFLRWNTHYSPKKSMKFIKICFWNWKMGNQIAIFLSRVESKSARTFYSISKKSPFKSAGNSKSITSSTLRPVTYSWTCWGVQDAFRPGGEREHASLLSQVDIRVVSALPPFRRGWNHYSDQGLVKLSV